MKKYILSLILFPFLSLSLYAQDKSNDVLYIELSTDSYGWSGERTRLHLENLLNLRPDFSGSKVDYYGNNGFNGSNGGAINLLGAYHKKEYKAHFLAALTAGYKYVVVNCDDPLRKSPEMFFEAVYSITDDIVKAGSIPVFTFQGEAAPEADDLEDFYRVVNGCGVIPAPLGAGYNELAPLVAYSGNNGGDAAELAYALSAMIYSTITGENANDTGYAPQYEKYYDTYDPLDEGVFIPIPQSNAIADVAYNTKVREESRIHYTTSFENQGAVRYRYFDPVASTGSSVVHHLYRGTSTEAGTASRINAILNSTGTLS